MNYMSDKIAGRVHVCASNRTVIREAWNAFSVESRKANDPETIKARKAFYIDCLASHKRNLDIVNHFRL